MSNLIVKGLLEHRCGGIVGSEQNANQVENRDRDGMADVWETRHGFDPDHASDKNGDADGDGHTNLQEFLSGTKPRG